MSQQEMGCHSGVTRWSGVSDNRGPHRETYIRLLVSPKRSSYLSSISMLTSFGPLQNLSLDKSIIVILEYTSSNHVKLLDHLRSTGAAHQPDIFRDFLRHIIQTG